MVHKFSLLFISLFAAVIYTTAQNKDIQHYINKAPFKMPAVIVPEFPDREFSIVDFGAVGNGHALNTRSIALAIDACVKAGGGKVVVPPGIYVTACIELKSNVNFHVSRGAIIQFTSDHTQYPIIKASAKSSGYTTASLIYGYGIKNTAITGEGIIDGFGQSWRPVKKSKQTDSQWKELVKSGGVVSEDGKIWWPSEEAINGNEYLKKLKKKPGKKLPQDYFPARVYNRPYMIYFSYCENVLVEGVNIRNAPKFVLCPKNCTNMTIKNINVYNEWYAQNGDGIDISACKNVIVYKCNVNVGDDAICMKSSGDDDEPHKINLENVIIAACNVYHGHGGFVIGSNTDGGMQNIFVNDLNFVGTDIGIRVKSGMKNGGTVKNIYIENIYMSQIQNEAISFNTFYEDRPAGHKEKKSEKEIENVKIPDFSCFNFKEIYCHDAHTGIRLTGLPEMPLQKFHFENIIITANEGFIGSDISNITLKNVTIKSNKEPLFDLYNAKNISINNCKKPESTKIYLKASGEETTDIIINNAELTTDDAAIQLSTEVDKKAVKIQH